MYFTCCFTFWHTSYKITCNNVLNYVLNLLINLLAHTVEVNIKFDLSIINFLYSCVRASLERFYNYNQQDATIFDYLFLKAF